MLTYGGVPLLIPDAGLCAWAKASIDPALCCPWPGPRPWPGPTLQRVPFPTGLVMPRLVKPGGLYWPQGASRWAYGHHFASAEYANVIRRLANGEDGKGTPQPLKFRMDDGYPGGETVNTDLYLLPPVPLARAGEQDGEDPEGLYLLTLVDVRYFWQWKATIAPGIDTTTTWTEFIADVAGALGISGLVTSTIAAAYLQPPTAFELEVESAAVVMDAIASCLGMRFTRLLDGTCRLQRFVDAIAERTEADAARSGEEVAPPVGLEPPEAGAEPPAPVVPRLRRAGGERFEAIL